jgi:hypothetical protein
MFICARQQLRGQGGDDPLISDIVPAKRGAVAEGGWRSGTGGSKTNDKLRNN